MQLFKISFILSVITLLVACAKHVPAPQPQTQQQTETKLLSESQADENKFALGPHEGKLGIRQYYFECDSVLLPEKYQSAAKAQAEYLKKHPNAKLEIQGFTEAGGSHDYNLTVAQQRAQHVGNYLQLKGASQNQMKLVSYGDEQALPYRGKEIAKDCRVDLVYLRAPD